MTIEQQTQIELLQELLNLHDTKSPFVTGKWHRESIERYTDPSIFARERERIACSLPQIAAHTSQLSEPGAYMTLELAAAPLLLVRDDEGVARAFYNVCRHRGARLVTDKAGCSKHLSCPYHAWTYSMKGDLIAVPHKKTGFPGLELAEHGLQLVSCEEYAGWIWVSLAADKAIDAREHLGEIGSDMVTMQAQEHVIVETTVREVSANWKILVEGGLEAYHFRVAHKNTIAPLFLDNLSTYRCFGRHIRSVLPRITLPELGEAPSGSWDIGKHANILYTLFPGSQFLVQEDHFVWIQNIPLSPDRTELRLSTLIPASANTPESEDYWRKNHQFTMSTLDEDFDLGESIQKGFDSGVNTHLNFGRYESALTEFNRFVGDVIA